MSTLSVATLKSLTASTPPAVQDSAGTEIGTFCRAWVNFSGASVTNPASMTGIRSSFNVSSILDNGIGDYTINFTTAMPDANYAVVTATEISTDTSSTRSGQTLGIKAGTTPTTTQLTVLAKTGSNTVSNAANNDNNCYVAIFR